MRRKFAILLQGVVGSGLPGELTPSPGASDFVLENPVKAIVQFRGTADAPRGLVDESDELRLFGEVVPLEARYFEVSGGDVALIDATAAERPTVRQVEATVVQHRLLVGTFQALEPGIYDVEFTLRSGSAVQRPWYLGRLIVRPAEEG